MHSIIDTPELVMTIDEQAKAYADLQVIAFAGSMGPELKAEIYKEFYHLRYSYLSAQQEYERSMARYREYMSDILSALAV